VKTSRLLTGLSLQESLQNLNQEEKQMTAFDYRAGASSALSPWKAIDWTTAERHVLRLQMRIAKATRERKHGKARSLQWILTHSFYAKLLAVKRVSENKGSKTPGVDGVVWSTDAKKMEAVTLLKRRGYQPLPMRRVYIPKKNGKLRPLGIPCMIDKAQQALHLLGLEPISESIVDKNAYGFRPKRSVADAIEQLFIVLCRRTSAQWILEGDIKACFDKIGHDWLMKNIPMDKTILGKWLKSGFVDKGLFYHTDAGTPQGGIISPTLMLLTLSGLEQRVKQAVRKDKDRVNFISYADDFVITGLTKELLETKIKPIVEEFLQERGLELSPEKTLITHIDDGFDFLGFNIRKYKEKLLIKPAKQNVLAFVRNIKNVIKKHSTMAAGDLIRILNPKINGWGNFYRHSVASKTFGYVENQIFQSLYAWSMRRHPNKGKRWVVNKYFTTPATAPEWKFHGVSVVGGIALYQSLKAMNKISIKRHVKIKCDANPYDPDYVEYFQKRSIKRPMGRNTWIEMLPTAL
jgi:RNA-directed DNA polymerase